MFRNAIIYFGCWVRTWVKNSTSLFFHPTFLVTEKSTLLRRKLIYSPNNLQKHNFPLFSISAHTIPFIPKTYEVLSKVEDVTKTLRWANTKKSPNLQSRSARLLEKLPLFPRVSRMRTTKVSFQTVEKTLHFRLDTSAYPEHTWYYPKGSYSSDYEPSASLLKKYI